MWGRFDELKGNGMARTPGRPREHQDEDFLNAVARVLSASADGDVTLDAVAAEVGCSRPAVNRRFGGRTGLLKAFIQWIIDQVDPKFVSVERETSSPLAILKAGSFAFSTGKSGSVEIAAFEATNQLIFFSKAWTDPDLQPLMEQLSYTFERSSVRYLRRAVEAGELHPCDVDELAYLLTVAIRGAVLYGRRTPEIAMSALHHRAFDAVLRPYIVDGPQDAGPRTG